MPAKRARASRAKRLRGIWLCRSASWRKFERRRGNVAVVSGRLLKLFGVKG